jgi:glutamate formiminotransferase/formiminotetrahydrofolate cyclodeaminase
LPVFYYDDATFELMNVMVRKGNTKPATDAAVGVLATRDCIRGDYLNVRVNVSGLKDRVLANILIAKGREIEEKTAEIELEIIDLTSANLRRFRIIFSC